MGARHAGCAPALVFAWAFAHTTLAAAAALGALVTGSLHASAGGGIGLALTPVLSLISGLPAHRLRKVIGAVALVLALLQLLFMRARLRMTHHWAVGSGIGVLIGRWKLLLG